MEELLTEETVKDILSEALKKCRDQGYKIYQINVDWDSSFSMEGSQNNLLKNICIQGDLI